MLPTTARQTMRQDLKNISARVSSIAPFHVMRLLERAKQLESQGHQVIHMEVGEPDFQTPAPIVDAGIAALKGGQTFYTPAPGLPELRQQIAAFYLERYQATVVPERIFVTPGASGALLLALSLTMDAGQEVLLPDPGYPCNKHFIELLSGSARAISIANHPKKKLMPEHIRSHWRNNTCAALVASPANPTGTTYSVQEITDLHLACRENGGVLLLDEIYHGLDYEDNISSACQVSDDIIVVNSFSKYFGMTGWRLGWLVVPETLCEMTNRLMQNIFIAASTPAQYAALSAFQPDTIKVLEQRRRCFQQRRDYLLPQITELGFKPLGTPSGAFYLYADCSDLADNSYSLCETLLEKYHLAITPGADFETTSPEKFVRFAYTTDMDKLKIAVERIRQWKRDTSE
tara:strand:- start:187 stop:1395 length:1209 start_codon:yes stop_codon:yes gene_type:complete